MNLMDKVFFLHKVGLFQEVLFDSFPVFRGLFAGYRRSCFATRSQYPEDTPQEVGRGHCSERAKPQSVP